VPPVFINGHVGAPHHLGKVEGKEISLAGKISSYVAAAVGCHPPLAHVINMAKHRDKNE